MRNKTSLIVGLLTGSLCVLTAAGNEPTQVDTQSRLTALVEFEGSIVFAALYFLPETKDAFVHAAPRDDWARYDPTEIGDYLSQEDRTKIVQAAALRLERRSPLEREQFFQRLDRWLMAWRQLEGLSAVASPEEVASAAYLIPVTHPIFDFVVKSRGFDPEGEFPLDIGSTMSSGEHSEVRDRLLSKLSTLKRRGQIQYFRDLYDKLLETMVGE